MDLLVFQERLLYTTIGRCRVLLIMLCLLVATTIFNIAYKLIKKTNRGAALIDRFPVKHFGSPKIKLNHRITSGIILSIFFACVLCWRSVSAYHDIYNQQYIELPVQAIHVVSPEYNMSAYGSMTVIDCNGNKVSLNLPYDYTKEGFPIGIGGTVWYAEETKVALAFIPQDRLTKRQGTVCVNHNEKLR